MKKCFTTFIHFIKLFYWEHRFLQNISFRQYLKSTKCHWRPAGNWFEIPLVEFQDNCCWWLEQFISAISLRCVIRGRENWPDCDRQFECTAATPMSAKFLHFRLFVCICVRHNALNDGGLSFIPVNCVY